MKPNPLSGTTRGHILKLNICPIVLKLLHLQKTNDKFFFSQYDIFSGITPLIPPRG
jgi:hypothetical protein